MRRATLGDTHPLTLGSIYNLGSLLQSQGDLEGALICFMEELDGCTAQYGDAHQETRSSAQGEWSGWGC